MYTLLSLPVNNHFHPVHYLYHFRLVFDCLNLAKPFQRSYNPDP